MTVRRLICVCGSSVALGLTSASAQETTTTDRQNDTLTRSLQTGSAENVDRILEQRQGVWRVDVMLSEDFWKKSGSGHTGVNQKYVTPGQRSVGGDTTKPTGGQDATQTDRTTPPAGQEKDDPSNPWFKQPEGQQRDATTQTGQPATTNRATQTAMPGMKHMSGYADCDMVLGDNVLHERIVVPTAGQDLGIPADDQTDPAAQTDMTGGDGFRGITMISFNEDSKTYDMVMLTNQHEGIKYDTGIYDAQRNRVVFRGGASNESGSGDLMDKPTKWQDKPADQRTGDNSWQTDPNRDRDDSRNQGDLTDDQTDPLDRDRLTDDQTDSQNRDDLTDNQADSGDRYDLDPTPSSTRQPATDSMTHRPQGHSNIIVVLEVVDDNTQRVTMYDASAASGLDTTTQPRDWDRPATDDVTDLDKDRTTTDSTNLDQDRENDLNNDLDDDRDIGDDFDGRKDRDPLNQDSGQTRSQPSTTMAGSEFGKIIYQATYTRADSSREASIRSMIDREIVVASR
jgi:hypothetical protein